MIDLRPVENAEDEAPCPFRLDIGARGAAPGPLVFASPHSGRIYPTAMMAASRLDAHAIRGSEDAFVDSLIETAPTHGIPTISARFARAFLDVNRAPWELDPGMFEDALPHFARAPSARVAAGLGAIARIVGEGQEIYARKLTFADAEARVKAVHAPFHAALSALIARARHDGGIAILIDWHSMPSQAGQAGTGGGGSGGRKVDIVLGDRFGAACAPAIMRRVEREFIALGYSVARNAPYAGGYTTEHYGSPRLGVNALQVEISRALYLDETTLELNANFDSLKRDLDALFGRLRRVEWSKL